MALSAAALAGACGDDIKPSGSDAGTTPDGGGADAGPVAPVTAPSATYSGPCDEAVALSWTNPGSQAGVLIARSTARDVPGVPEDGTAYSAGDELPGGGLVVFSGDASSFDDTADLFHGDDLRYSLFAFDVSARYSTGAPVGVVIDESIEQQIGQIQVNLNNNNTNITQPSLFTIATVANYDSGNTTLTLDITITSQACRAFNSPKLIVTGTNEAGSVPAGDAFFAGDAVMYPGPRTLLDAGILVGQLTFTNVSGAVNSYDVDLELREDPLLILGGQFQDAAQVLDSAGLPIGAVLDGTATGFGGNGDSHTHSGVLSPDGSLLYVGHAQQPAVVVADLSTGDVVLSTDLTGANDIQNDGTGSIGYVGDVVKSPDHRYLYTTLVTGDHRNFTGPGDLSGRIVDTGNNPVDIALVRLDRATLAEVDRLVLVDDSLVRPRVRSISVTADGRLAAIPVRSTGQLFVVDLDSMTLVGGSAVDLSARGMSPHEVAFNGDGTQIAIAYRGFTTGAIAAPHPHSFDIYDVAGGTFQEVTFATAGDTADNPRVGNFVFHDNGSLYVSRKDSATSLSVFDGALAETEVVIGQNLRGIRFLPGGTTYIAADFNEVFLRAVADNTAVPFPAGVNSLVASGFGHMILVTRH